MQCVNKSSAEYQTLKNTSGIPEQTLEPICRSYLDTLGRFPNLDELPGDSSSTLKDNIKLRQNESTKIDNLLEYTNTSNVQDANIALNNIHSDLEVKVIPLNTEAIVKIEKRPTPYRELEKEKTDTSSADTTVFLNQFVDKLSKLYGININTITTSELSSDEFANKVIDPEYSAAFIYNGQIYINTDIASIDAPIHELLHLLLGGLRFKYSELYSDLVNKAEQFNGYENLKQLYKNRTRMDINEEIFVSELAKHLTGQKSQLDGLDEATMYEISYNTHRMLDTLIKGKWSSITLGDKVYNMTLRSLVEELNSVELNNNFQGSLTDAQIHRTLANRKQELFEQNVLKEYC